MSKQKTRVGLAKEGVRRANVFRAMQQVSADLLPRLQQRILIKPNFLSATQQQITTHPDAVRGVLDFLVAHGIRPSDVLIAEGGHNQKSDEAYRAFGYVSLEEEYDLPIRWMNLHAETAWETTEVRLADDAPATVRMPKTVVDHPCTISVAVAKTHDAAVVTLAIKNMIMGCLHGEDRIKVHGYFDHKERALPREGQVIQANLARLSRYLAPHIAVIDGTVGIQGNGPGGNDRIDLGVAVASADPFAADAVMALAMGFDPGEIGLLVYAQQLGLGVTELAEIEVLGPALEAAVRPFKPHETNALQLQWRDAAIAAQLL